MPDVTFGSRAWLRGHWRDRVPALDADIAEMAGLAANTNGGGMGVTSGAASAAAQVLALPPARGPAGTHVPPAPFRRGHAVTLGLNAGAAQRSRLHVRRVNQANASQGIAMDSEIGRFLATVPAAYTDSPFRLRYLLPCCATTMPRCCRVWRRTCATSVTIPATSLRGRGLGS